jgi:MFS family permease
MTSLQSTAPDQRATRFRYVIIGMLFMMAVVNYVDRGALSYTSEQLIKQYGFSKSEWGAVLGYFGYGYIFGAVIGGTLSDRLGPRKVWIYAGTIWSLFEIATAYAGDIGMALFGGSAIMGFAVMRVLFGFAEGPAFSTINKSVSNWAAPRERAVLADPRQHSSRGHDNRTGFGGASAADGRLAPDVCGGRRGEPRAGAVVRDCLCRSP